MNLKLCFCKLSFSSTVKKKKLGRKWGDTRLDDGSWINQPRDLRERFSPLSVSNQSYQKTEVFLTTQAGWLKTK